MEADVPADKKSPERTESAATAVQAKYGDSCSANLVDPDPKSSASFGDGFTESPAFPCSRDDALVDNGAVAPKSSLAPGDAHTKNRRWLTPRRHNLYSDVDYLRPATSLVLSDRRDKFKDFNSIRLVQPASPLLVEGS